MSDSTTTLADNLTQSQGCIFQVPNNFTNFCDIALIWGIIVTGLAGLGLLLTLIFTIAFSANIRRYIRHEKNRYSTLLYFLLLGIFLLFAFSITFVIKPSLINCILRRAGMGISWTFILAPLLVGITRKWKMSFLDEIRCGWLSSAVVSFVAVEAIILVQWNILKTPNVTSSGRCETNEYDIALSLIFNAVLLVAFFISSAIACCKPERHISSTQKDSSYAISSLLTSIGLMLLWASWAAMISYGLDAIGYEEWQDPTTGMFMVTSGIFTLITIFGPVFHTMRKIKRNDPADYNMNAGLGMDISMHPFGQEKYSSQTTLPTSTGHRTSSYGAIEEFERARSFRQENITTMSSLNDIKPIPQKRHGNHYVDRVRAPTRNGGGRLNPTLEMDEENGVINI